MQSEQLYAQILGLEAPWKVSEVKLDVSQKTVEVMVVFDPDRPVRCPECDAAGPRHDTRRRSWRHLDTCQMKTILTADIPRVSCSTHGVLQMSVPWAVKGSRFTALFEALVIDWLKSAPVSVVASRLSLTWDQVDGVMQRAVDRGLARREQRLPSRLGVDETSFQKRHEYVTVVHDLDAGHVVHVADGRGREALGAFLGQFDDQERARVEVVTMDMHAPYIAAVAEHIPDGRRRIAFDKYHVAALLGRAVDLVRRQEHKALLERGDKSLKGTKYQWLRNPTQMTDAQWEAFASLREANLKTARAWAIKETAMEMWDADGEAETLTEGWRRVLRWAGRSKLEPMKRAAATLRAHLDGIVLAQLLEVTNAIAEGLNSVIQKMKFGARGFRNRERFRRAILFHRGGLDLYPISS